MHRHTAPLWLAARLQRERGYAQPPRVGAAGGIATPASAYAAFALGAGDTTVEKMVNAYSALVNWGRINQPSVIDYVQDRRGKVIWRADNRDCTGCNMAEWDGQPMPRFGAKGRQAMDPRTAYQTVHMLEGVVTRGTAVRLRSLDMPLFGKTGTSQDFRDAWFVGFAGDVVVGVWLGNDDGKPMRVVTGGGAAAAIWRDFMTHALR